MAPADESADTVADGIANPSYAFRPSLASPSWQFKLTHDSLEWDAGRNKGRTSYDAIRRVRLTFRPMTMQSHRFLTEIWPESGGKLRIASTSWKSMVEHARQDNEYAAFIRELHRRMAAAGSDAAFERGQPPIQYWIGFAIFGGVALGLAVLVVRGLQGSVWAGAAFVAAFLALFLWQIGGFVKRNRPGRYRPDDVPDELLPR